MVRMKIIILKLLIFNSSNRVDRFSESGIYLEFRRNHEKKVCPYLNQRIKSILKNKALNQMQNSLIM